MSLTIQFPVAAAFMAGSSLIACNQAVQAAGEGWSVVPYIGFSQLGDQSPLVSAQGISNGEADITVDSGFVGGLGIRYDYQNSRWTSEIGWEYRSNDSSITASDGTELPAGNYASNTFYLNGRYALKAGSEFTPWVGGGLSLVQEIDIDSEGPDGERSFEDSGAVGFQLMAGIDYAITERIYLTSELRYTDFTDLDLDEEVDNGRVSGLNYQPVTASLGVGFRF